jgi:hypothetical protein
MPAKKRIVVDASVARSAGQKPVPDFVSARSRDVLEAILRARHRVAFSAEGLAEWREHRSRFARGWLVQMFSRRLTVLLGDTTNTSLRDRLRPCCSSESKWQALEKDCHLVEAALQVDRVVVSRDEIVRDLFRQACAKVAELRDVLWANPELEEEQVVAWLEAGAKDEQARRLAFLNPSG